MIDDETDRPPTMPAHSSPPPARPESDSRAMAMAKWRTALSAGFQIIPDVLIRAQSKLEFDTVDLAVVLNITMHWWRANELPYPRPSVIARRIGVSTRTVERRIARLEERGLIERLAPERTKDGLSVRRIDLSGLVATLEAMAEKNLASRQMPDDSLEALP